MPFWGLKLDTTGRLLCVTARGKPLSVRPQLIDTICAFTFRWKSSVRKIMRTHILPSPQLHLQCRLMHSQVRKLSERGLCCLLPNCIGRYLWRQGYAVPTYLAWRLELAGRKGALGCAAQVYAQVRYRCVCRVCSAHGVSMAHEQMRINYRLMENL